MDDRRVADYFVVAGLPEIPLPLEEFSNEAVIKPTHKQDPITDIAVINKSLGEKVPKGFTCLERTPSSFPADLNHGSIRCSEMFLCFRRSRDKAPLTDVGVLYEGKERLMSGCEVVHTTPHGNPANVNNSNSGRIYITYRRAGESASSDTLAVMDICIILTNKNETPPHAYCQIGKNLNKGMVGSDIFLCYKKAMCKADVLAYKPAILARYPLEDYDSFPLPESVPMFCLPMGATVECWSAKAQHPLPVFSTFVLTGSAGEKCYGAAVTFYEEFPEEKLTDLQMRHLGLKNKHIREQYRILKTVHSNKSICLLSHWPFFDAFRKFLSYLYRISITGPHTVPIERHISHFMFDVPYPSPQRPRILVQLSHEALSLSMPEDSPLPQSGASFINLLKNLGPENCMSILSYVLLEHKIVIHSLRPSVLTGVAEAVSTMLFPCHWQCPYIPLCPLGLSDVLCAPCPFIVGIDSRFFDLYDPPSDVICIDLDTITIWMPDDKKSLNYKQLPKKPAKVLQETLHKLFDKLCQQPSTTHNQDEISLEMAPIDYDFKRKEKETVMELAIQEAFLRFMACLLKGYKQFLKPIVQAPTLRTTDATSLFDMQGFLKSRDKAYTKFFNNFMKTQTFIRFIEERSFVSDKDASLAFFDDCAEKVDENTAEPRLIDLDESSQKSERTVFIMPPEPVGLPEGATYSYNGFPDLMSELFLRKNLSTLSLPGKQSLCPNSPIAKRTKHEIRTAQKMAQHHVLKPNLWAKCLLGHCYSLWFIHLPAYVKSNQSTIRALQTAYDVLKKMQTAKLHPPDEVCYRVMLHLCGQYNQPVLAVKVYYQMKRAGVQPNAITYGYYNKAVLEGKWPTSKSKGALLWKKLRNVVIGVAQFRRAVRRRSLSICSNSGSDYDQISHTSVDSYLEDIGGDKPGEIHRAGEFVTNLAQVDEGSGKGSLEERISTGGISDRGYSSMTHEDARQLSQAISSVENADSEQTTENKKKEPWYPLKFSLHRKHRKKEVTVEEHPVEQEMEKEMTFPPHDHSPSAHFGNRAGSIVRKSIGSVGSQGSHDTLKGSIIGNSSAGLLMVSQSSLDNVFLHRDIDLTGSLNAGDNQRKRHRSAGENHPKPRSNSLFAHWRPRHVSGDTGLPVRFSELIRTEPADEIFQNMEGSHHCNTGGEKGIGEMQDILENIKDSGVALDENPQNGVHADELNEIDTNNSNSADVFRTSECTCPEDISPCSGPLKINTDQQTNPTNSSPSSTTSSPQHSLRTPVTENDPLGLFSLAATSSVDSSLPNQNSIISFSPSTLPEDGSADHTKILSSTPVSEGDLESRESSVPQPPRSCIFKLGASTDSGKLYNSDSLDSSIANRVGISSSESAQVLSPVERLGKRFADLARTNSSPDCLQLEKEKVKLWPIRGFGSSDSSKAKQIRSSMSLNESVKTDLKSDSKLHRAGSFRKHNESFGGLMKFAASAVANKFNEIKQSMSTPTKFSGSVSSLSQSIDECDSGTGEEDNQNCDSIRELPKKFSGSLDFLSSKTENSHDDSGVDGVKQFGSAPSPSYLEQYIPMKEFGEKNPQFGELKDSNSNIAMEIEISSCSRCIRCRKLLYDEEIMAGWSPDDSNLNTTCQFCLAKLVPHLQVYVKDWRQNRKSLLVEPGGLHPEDFENMTGQREPSICSSISNCDNNALMFEEYALDHNLGQELLNSSVSPSRSEDSPWTRHVPDTIPDAVPTVAITIEDMARSGHRRCASECLTSATDNVSYGSSFESTDGLAMRMIRSPLSISIDEDMELPTGPSRVPEMKKDVIARTTSTFPPITIPYLSPLVLRKELENIVDQEGDMSLATDSFIDEHPIIFWNLVWYFRRVNIPSHLAGFLLTARTTNTDLSKVSNLNCTYNTSHVLIRPLWDNVRIHEEVGLPMYMAWNEGHSSTTVDALVETQAFNRPLMHQVITSIQCNDLLTPVKLVSNARRRHRPRKNRYRSMYREILFLSFIACGRENIDPDAFDREFKLAFTRLGQAEMKRLQLDDRPRSDAVAWCRRVFGDLEV